MTLNNKQFLNIFFIFNALGARHIKIKCAHMGVRAARRPNKNAVLGTIISEESLQGSVKEP